MLFLVFGLAALVVIPAAAALLFIIGLTGMIDALTRAEDGSEDE